MIPPPQVRTPDPAAYSPMHQLLWSPLCFPEASGVPGRGTCAWGRTPGSDLWENLPSPLSKSPKPCPSSEVPIHTWQVGRAPFRSVGSGGPQDRFVCQTRTAEASPDVRQPCSALQKSGVCEEQEEERELPKERTRVRDPGEAELPEGEESITPGRARAKSLWPKGLLLPAARADAAKSEVRPACLTWTEGRGEVHEPHILEGWLGFVVIPGFIFLHGMCTHD